jgi:hypothetical protein
VRIFISFAKRDAKLAAQLEVALRRNNSETWSGLDVASGDDWQRIVDHEIPGQTAMFFSSVPVRLQIHSSRPNGGRFFE